MHLRLEFDSGVGPTCLLFFSRYPSTARYLKVVERNKSLVKVTG